MQNTSKAHPHTQAHTHTHISKGSIPRRKIEYFNNIQSEGINIIDNINNIE